MEELRQIFSAKLGKIQPHFFHLLLLKKKSWGKEVWALCKIEAYSNWMMASMWPTQVDRYR
jgi:hypothetical protein